MPIALPSIIQMPTPNYTPVAIVPDLTVLHFTEGGYNGSRAWLCDPRARASAHRVMKADGREVTQHVPMLMKAWHACLFNGRALSLEIEGFTANGFSDVTLESAAQIAAWDCLAYGIPPVWAQGGKGRGVCCHHDLGADGGGHHDICEVGDATWQRMMTAVQNIYAEMKALPSLPAWALHGAPGPHEVVVTPDVRPEPSHAGAIRAEANDNHAHATPSRYPAHSIAALQDDLNRLFATQAPLEVDGRFGALTKAAVQRFQLQAHLDNDGVPGPATWAALDRAMAA